MCDLWQDLGLHATVAAAWAAGGHSSPQVLEEDAAEEEAAQGKPDVKEAAQGKLAAAAEEAVLVLAA